MRRTSVWRSLPRSSDLTSLPALCRGVVARARIHPALSIRGLLLLPEWRLRLQVVHDELARREGFATMGTGYRYEDDLIGRAQRAHPMNNPHVHDLPARLGLLDDLRQRLLGHAG